MTADEFVAIVRKGNDKLRVDEIVIDTGEQRICGKGMMWIGSKEIKVEVSLDPGQGLPEMKRGIYTKRDCWKLNGVIEDHLQFTCNHVPPVGTSRWSNERTRVTFGLNPFELVPSGFEALSPEQRKQFWEAENEQRVARGEPSIKIEPSMKDESAQFHAVLLGYPLLAFNSDRQVEEGHPFFYELKNAKAPGFVGQFQGVDYALMKDSEGDLHVHLRLKAIVGSKTIQDDWKTYYAFMGALAFVHGVNAWPFRVEYWRNHQKLTDRIMSAAELEKTSHAPFTKALGFDAKLGKLKWDMGLVLGKATAFFEQETALTKEIAQILFLLRQADSGVHPEITTLAVCALLENLVHAVFKHTKLEESNVDPDIQSFERAKEWTCSQIDKEILANVDPDVLVRSKGLDRLKNYVKSVSAVSQREIFQGVCRHFGLTWENDMELEFNNWKMARNALFHAKARADETEDQVKESLQTESRVTGLVNVLVLKVMGYSGWVRVSAFDNKYREI